MSLLTGTLERAVRAPRVGGTRQVAGRPEHTGSALAEAELPVAPSARAWLRARPVTLVSVESCRGIAS